MIDQPTVIGADLGGSKFNLGIVKNGNITDARYKVFKALDTEANTLSFVISSIQELMSPAIQGISIGVPSVVDVENGIVYNAVNIPAWQEVHLKKVLEQAFNVPVYVSNDVNCFVFGEKYFGKAQGHSDVVGVCLGTGMGVGLIINDRLHAGKNCGAGEFGSIAYEGMSVEHYCSGYFFKHFHGASGKELYTKAQAGDRNALDIFAEFGRHLGKAIAMIILAFDPEMIVFGGAVSRAFPFFIESAKAELKSLPFRKTVERLVIEQSENDNIAILGAAALYLNSLAEQPYQSAM